MFFTAYRLAHAITINTIESVATSTPTNAPDSPKLASDEVLVEKTSNVSNERSLEQEIAFYAKEYNIPEQWLINLATCESTMGKNLVGDGGRAYGIMQYHAPTWSDFERWSGMDLDRYSTRDQIKMTAWALSVGKGGNWSCNYKTGKVR